jgi:hypothetical protein
MTPTRILITVKTYPTLSSKYGELVCTAGFREDGTWVRIYPMPFRKKPNDQRYKKYDWIEIDLVKNEKDYRPESYRPFSHDSEIKILDHITTKDNWAKRKKFVLGKVDNNLRELITRSQDKNICTSLAVFKPSKILDFTIEEVEREWDKTKVEKLLQEELFQQSENPFDVVEKLPYKFSYVFEDIEGKKSKLMIEDWEIGQLYRNCLARHKGDETKAVEDVKKKYFDDFAKTKDLHLFLGTTQSHHYGSHNPFIIIGVFYPKK